MQRFLNCSALLLLNTLFLTWLPAQEPAVTTDSMALALVRQNADSLLNSEWFVGVTGYQKKDSTTISSVVFLKKPNRIRVYADKQLAYAPFREATIDTLLSLIGSDLEEPYNKHRIELFSGRENIRTLVPNYYRSSARTVDKRRSTGKLKRKSPPLVRNLSKPYLTGSALYNINIALWHSHGWYYESKLNRWEWQRARIFQTVEDIYPLSYTMPFLVPMLENAGANVFVPRERDWQVNEVVVDNNGSSGRSLFVAPEYLKESESGSGFALGNPPYVDENPFRLGSYQTMISDRKATGSIQWIPEIPETGEYAVYISFQASSENVNDALYRVHHMGGVTEFTINQQMGGGTWVYLGKFSFTKGIDTESGRVVLSNRGARRGKMITADAVKFGGGVGNIARNGFTSQRPRYQECARYYLQYAGMPDTLVWKLNDSNDYNDDYQSRGEWVNYLVGAPSGPTANRKAKGLGIPVDLSFAFHTDAGITNNDTVIGTLGIYSTTYDRGYFPGGLSKLASRDLTDIVQSQIVEDLRASFDPAWTRRGMWDRGYSEAFRPNVPTMLLELFSHQNFIDMRFGQEPMFRFHVSRAIYKGMLKFLDTQYGTGYIVQPLPVDHLQTGIDQEGNIELRWKPVSDPLEPTAEAESYMVYTRINGGGFDNGTPVATTRYVKDNLQPDSIYSFKVTAVNGGGESFPSEVLSVCTAGDSKGTVAIINAFDRTSGPAWFNDERYAGFMNMVDQGVPYGVDLHTVGDQYDYLKDSPWLDDDSPGHGASYADLEAVVIPGNSFDFSYMHGLSIRNAGYSFVSVSDESVIDDSLELSSYCLVDYLAGEERSTYMPKNDSVCHYQVWPDSMLNVLEDYLQGGGRLFVTGAHIASDSHFQQQDSMVGSLLKFKWRTSNASRLGQFYSMDPEFAGMSDQFRFNTVTDPFLYRVEGADALEPVDSTAITLLRYAENNMSAGVAFRGEYGVVAMGFPFESIVDLEMRDIIMKKTLTYLLEQKDDE
ncbi:MAG: fibronectin type III domain-containing protein [Bacteroidales bacterium]|nr:fibronectin type III domain-containing protein [Bacteroidales bacterium]